MQTVRSLRLAVVRAKEALDSFDKDLVNQFTSLYGVTTDIEFDLPGPSDQLLDVNAILPISTLNVSQVSMHEQRVELELSVQENDESSNVESLPNFVKNYAEMMDGIKAIVDSVQSDLLCIAGPCPTDFDVVIDPDIEDHDSVTKEENEGEVARGGASVDDESSKENLFLSKNVAEKSEEKSILSSEPKSLLRERLESSRTVAEPIPRACSVLESSPTVAESSPTVAEPSPRASSILESSPTVAEPSPKASSVLESSPIVAEPSPGGSRLLRRSSRPFPRESHPSPGKLQEIALARARRELLRKESESSSDSDSDAPRTSVMTRRMKKAKEIRSIDLANDVKLRSRCEVRLVRITDLIYRKVSSCLKKKCCVR